MDIRKIYEYALNREYEGKRFFEENANRLSHAAAISAFQQLAAEEQKHINFIQNQINNRHPMEPILLPLLSLQLQSQSKSLVIMR